MFGLFKRGKIILALNPEKSSEFSVRYFCPDWVTAMKMDIYFPKGAVELNIDDCRIFVSPSCLSITTNGQMALNIWQPKIEKKDIYRIDENFILLDSARKVGITVVQKDGIKVVRPEETFSWVPKRDGTLTSFIKQKKIKPDKKRLKPPQNI